jgi:hypothetical protein
MWALVVPRDLCAQPHPHEERERQYQRPGPEFKARARMRTDGSKALIGRFIIISDRPGAVATGILSGVTEAGAGRAAFAPGASNRVTGQRHDGERRGSY